MKKLLILILVIVVVAVGVLFIAFDSLLKRGIETAGSAVLQTEVSVSSVGVSPLSGSGGIRELRIGNPEGFTAPYAMELGSLEVSIEPGSVFSDVVVINSILIEQPQITYERKITTDNMRTLLDNIGGGSRSPASDEQGSGTSRRIIIRDFQLVGAQVNLVTAIASAPVMLPDLHLQNIGQDDAAVTVAEAGRQILAAINRELADADIPDLQMIRERAEQELSTRAAELEEKASQQATDLINRIPGLRQQ